MGTWNNAGAHGKVAAANMAGATDVRYHDVPEYSSKIFSEQTITQFGLSPEYRNDLTMVRSIEPEKKWVSRALVPRGQTRWRPLDRQGQPRR